MNVVMEAAKDTHDTERNACPSFATVFRVKELLRWVRNADTKQGARWRATRFFEFAWELAGDSALLEPSRKALKTFEEHLPRILRRWESLLSNARLEGINGLFQAAR